MLTAILLFACTEFEVREVPDFGSDSVELDDDTTADDDYTEETGFRDPDLPEFDEEVDGSGRMTGGGSVFAGGVRVTHGFTLRCETRHNDNLQVNFDSGESFHATSIEWIACYDDPALDPSMPSSNLDTVQGVALGRFDGVDGARVEFTFTDDGEPGTTDVASITVIDADGVVRIDANDVLTFGNHQAHGAGAPL
ncbi:MAG: hypothetical protein R3F61_28565 [Myxococcota bacterium]